MQGEKYLLDLVLNEHIYERSFEKKKGPLKKNVTGIYIKKFGKEIPDEVFV